MPKTDAPPLALWRKIHDVTLEGLVERMKPHLPRGFPPPDQSTLYRYEHRKIVRPTPEIVQAIIAVTGGAVTYLDLCPPTRGPKRVRKCA